MLQISFPSHFTIFWNWGDLTNWGILFVATISLLLGFSQWKSQFNHQQKVKFLDELNLLIRKLEHDFEEMLHKEDLNEKFQCIILSTKDNELMSKLYEEKSKTINKLDYALKEISYNQRVIYTYIKRCQFMKFKNASIFKSQYEKSWSELITNMNIENGRNTQCYREKMKEVSSIFEAFLEENYKALYK